MTLQDDVTDKKIAWLTTYFVWNSKNIFPQIPHSMT